MWSSTELFVCRKLCVWFGWMPVCFAESTEYDENVDILDLEDKI